MALCRREPARAAARSIAGLLSRVARIAGYIVALPGSVARPCCTPRPASPALCHDTIPYIVTQHMQMGSSPSSQVSCTLFFFSLIFFFHFVSPTGRLQKYIFYFYFQVEPNKLIRIYLCIFSSFKHCKTLKKISSIHIFFSYVLFTKHTNYTTYTTIHVIHTIHQNAQWMHDLTRFPSSPRYSYT